MSSGLYSGVSGLALGIGLYRGVSGLWGGASGLDAGFAGGSPYSGASLYLDFLTMTASTFDSRITFSRGTNATLTDSTGRIAYAPVNQLTYSQQFDNAGWSKNAVVITGDAGVAPDGTTTADKLDETGATAQHYIGFLGSYVANTTYIHSFYVKAAEKSTFNITLGTGAFGSGTNGNATFNLATGVVSSVSGTGATAGIIGVGNGWYRCYLVQAATTTTTNTSYISIAGLGSYTGTNGEGILIWGAQLEPVTYQTVPSTYVATAASAYYGPRFDYDPVTLAARGLLIEEQRTNLLTYSAQFDDVSWTKTRSSITANSTAAPDGTNAADTLVEDSTATSTHPISTAVTLTAAAHTLSIYVKASGRSWVQLNLLSTANAFANFNVSTGTLGTIGAAATATITSVGNGWYRCTMTATTGAGANTVAIYPASADNTVSYTGTSIASLFIWGVQLEVGAFSTSYIPTTTATATRNADVATMTGANFSDWYNQSQGTFVADTSTFKPTSSTAVSEVTSANDGTTNNRITTRFASNTADGVVVTSSSTVAAISTAYIAGVPTKLALATAANDFAFSVNGALIGTDTSGGMPTVNKLDIGNLTGFNFLNGHMRTIAYFNTRQPNTQLQTLTAPALVPSLSLDFINNVYNVGF